MAARPTTTSFARDILPLFRPKDIEHMRELGTNLASYDESAGRPRPSHAASPAPVRAECRRRPTSAGLRCKPRY